MNDQPQVFAWSLSGELLESVPLAELAATHGIEPRRLLAELLASSGRALVRAPSLDGLT